MAKKKSASAQAGGDVRVAIGPVLDAACGAELRARLDQAIETKDTVKLAGEEVERVDAAGLQLLIAFVSARQAAGRAIEWTGASIALRRSAELLGVSTLIGLTA